MVFIIPRSRQPCPSSAPWESPSTPWMGMGWGSRPWQSMMLQELEPAVREAPDGAAAFKRAKDTFDKALKALRKQAEETGKRLSNVFNFCEEVFGDGQEILILVTELTISYYGARFISRYGCPEYFRHNKEILFHERQQEIIAELEKLELEE